VNNEKCKFSEAWRGQCGAAAGESGYCEKHAAMTCSVCKAQATHDCAHTGQFVCGAPLCNDCEGHTDMSKPSGAWGFMNHTHRRKPGAAQVEAGNPASVKSPEIEGIKTVEIDGIKPERATTASAAPTIDTGAFRALLWNHRKDSDAMLGQHIAALITHIDQHARAHAEEARREAVARITHLTHERDTARRCLREHASDLAAVKLELIQARSQIAQRTAGGDRLAAALKAGYESGTMVSEDLGGKITLHYQSAAEANDAFGALVDALDVAPVAEAAAQADDSGDTLSDYDKILRGSVPERWKGCTSPIGAVQSYIAELEQRLAQYEPDWIDNEFDMGECNPHGLPSGAALRQPVALPDEARKPLKRLTEEAVGKLAREHLTVNVDGTWFSGYAADIDAFALAVMDEMDAIDAGCVAAKQARKEGA
jgi:hypothetical protein